MTAVWFLVWLIYHQPAVSPWNGWFIAMIVCLALDFIGAIESLRQS